MNLRETRKWCATAHRNQRYGGTQTDDGGMDGSHPYPVHLREVEAVAIRFGFRKCYSIRKACWAHDVIEDTGKTRLDLLTAGFSSYEVSLVWAVTDGKGRTRHQRKLVSHRKIRRTPDAIIVKLCDRIANVEHSMQSGYLRKYEMYKQEHAEFQQHLRDRNDARVTAMWEHLDWLFSDEGKRRIWGTRKCCNVPHKHAA